MKLTQLTNLIESQSLRDEDEMIDHFIIRFDFYDSAYARGVEFVADDIKKQYSRMADKTIARLHQQINKK